MALRRDLRLYPRWVKQDPRAAREALRAIVHALRDGADLMPSEREYLIAAITEILNGTNADAAFFLVGGKRGRRAGSQVVEHQSAIFYAVVEQLRFRKEPGDAIKAVAATCHRSTKTIEAIYYAERAEREQLGRLIKFRN